MSRWIILSVLVIAITAGATVMFQMLPASTTNSTGVAFPTATGTPAAKGPQPKAVVEGDPQYNFGTKAQHTKFEKEWFIKNEGKAPLRLSLEAPPCSCTVANFQGKDGKSSVSEISVEPGDKVPIHLTWDTRSYNEHYKKPATLLTNDPERPKITFTAEGEVRPAVVVYPDANIPLLELTTDEEKHTGKIAIFSPDRPDFKLTGVKTSKPDVISASWKPLTTEEASAIKTKEGFMVEVTIGRGLPLGAFQEELIFTTDHPKQPEVSVKVTGKMVGPVTVVPERLRMTDVAGNAGGSKELTILVRGQKDVKFDVMHAPKGLKVEVLEGTHLPKVRKYRMIVTIPPGTPAGTIEDEIILKTDHPLAAEIKVYANLLIRDAG
ncbi:DUF1573 domain-containing protein [Singulisphaera sp. PoT]|uniref:DUF1573 domain-containing protein n=1 Tax=Singulisphaera sp. PoT TaxID=3411797 RepID=UPI003BF46C11